MMTKDISALRNDPRGIHLLWVWVLALAASGCTAAVDTARLDTVARAGVAYAGKVPPLLDRAFEVAAAVDSRALVEAREGLSEEQRREALQRFDAAMAERLEDYDAAKRHNDLLRSYFVALRSLLESDGSKGSAAAAKRLTAALGTLSPRLKQARMGDVSVSGRVEPAVAVTVASFGSAALRRELEARGAAIERELALQEALVAAVARQVRADRDILSARFRSDEVVTPYVSAKRLPKTWPARRLKSLREPTGVAAALAAEQAVGALRQAYVAAVEGRLDAGRAAELGATVEGFVELVSRLGAEAGRLIR
ncbi:MAG: hypothetical protein OXF11_03535 [Deltaproteobacteria bacterium]|nr:hypothetical protein [Deltaproteobacteria bacterium]